MSYLLITQNHRRFSFIAKNDDEAFDAAMLLTQGAWAWLFRGAFAVATLKGRRS